jgi:alanine racemase
MFEKYRRVFATIDLDNLNHNLEVMTDTIIEGQCFAVIKADAYGHGAKTIAKYLENKNEVFGFATATFEEALELRKAGIQKKILILGYTFPYVYKEMIQHQITPTVFRFDQAEELQKVAKCLNVIMDIHIKVDVGMNRIGISPDEQGILFIEQIAKFSNLKIGGIFTHFPKADMLAHQETKSQLNLFLSFVEKVETLLAYKIECIHAANSAAIIQSLNANLKIARAGIGMYGLWPSEEMDKCMDLKPVLSLKSEIVYLKDVESNTEISYGGTFITYRPSKIATIPVGYGDGYPRSLSNKGFVLIKGHKAPIAGRICMDQFMIDVTDVPDVKIGDPVILIGTDGINSIRVEDLDSISGRFHYELVCNLGKRIPRIYKSKNNYFVED